MKNKQIKFLKNAYKKEENAKVRERILMIIYTNQKETLRDVAERLNCDHKLVFYWKMRYKKEGLKGLKTRPKSGKPRKISLRQESNLKKIFSNENSNFH